MSFAHDGASSLDYAPCRYGASRLLFRGPKVSFDAPYIACFGGTETYGRCVPAPYPALLAQALQKPVANFGQPNAGIDAFVADPEMPRLLAGAEMAVVQVLGAVNMSNRFYRVHPRRNDRFLTASPMLTAIYPEIDFTEFSFNRHMLGALRACDADRFRLVEDELRTAWSARMQLLLAGQSAPVVLLRLTVSHADPIGVEPALVTDAMIDAVRDRVRGVVEVDTSAAGPADDMQGMVVGPMEGPIAEHLIGPKTHARVAGALMSELS